MCKKTCRNQQGFTLTELLVAVAILVVITALAAPTVWTAVSRFRLRGTADSIAGLLARGRALAVQRNCTYVARNTYNSTQDQETYYIEPDLAYCGGDSSLSAQDPQAVGAKGVRVVTTPTTTISTTVLGFQPQPANTLPRFNSRGLPCVKLAGSACVTIDASNRPVGFFYYLQDTRTSGSAGMVGVSVSPAGRIKVWSKSGSQWMK